MLGRESFGSFGTGTFRIRLQAGSSIIETKIKKRADEGRDMAVLE
jgi:hypothetical protein